MNYVPCLSRGEALEPVSRWSARRRRQILDAICAGRVTRDEVKTAHSISEDEMAGWERKLALGGEPALRTTRGLREPNGECAP